MSIGRNNLRTQSLDLLRLPLALFVVTVHVFDTTGVTLLEGKHLDTTCYPIFMALNAFIDAFVRGVSVPVYFFISGYVFFLNVDWGRQTYIRKLKNRVKTLFIPYIVWISLEIVLTVVTHLPLFSSLMSYAGTEIHLTLSTLLSCFWQYHGDLVSVSSASFNEGIDVASPYPLVVPLWFLRDLMIVVLCAPFLYLLLKKFKYWTLFGLGVLYVVPMEHRFNLLVTAFFFFSWGAYMSISRKDMLEAFRPYFKWSLFAYLVSGMVLLLWHVDGIQRIFTVVKAFSALLLAYNLAAWLLQNSYCRVNTFLASASFFIYVSHALLCQRLRKVCFVIMHPQSDWGVIGTYVFCEVLLVILLLAAFYLMRQYTPSVLKVIAGRK